MQIHQYKQVTAGWAGYVELADGGVLFVAPDGGTYLQRADEQPFVRASSAEVMPPAAYQAETNEAASRPDPPPSDELRRRFTYHPPTPEMLPKFVDVRHFGLLLAAAVERLCPPGREAALALTNIEEAVMWANAAIARPIGPKPHRS